MIHESEEKEKENKAKETKGTCNGTRVPCGTNKSQTH
jgi:hypothetical protein